jgi:hypothetical protein
MTVTGQEIVQDIETVSGIGLYSVVTYKVNCPFLSFLPLSLPSILSCSLSPFASCLSVCLSISSLHLSHSLSISLYLSPSYSLLASLCHSLTSVANPSHVRFPYDHSLLFLLFDTTQRNAQEFVVINGIVASPFARSHFVANIYYNLHRAIYATLPSVLQFILVKQSNEVRGK